MGMKQCKQVNKMQKIDSALKQGQTQFMGY